MKVNLAIIGAGGRMGKELLSACITYSDLQVNYAVEPHLDISLFANNETYVITNDIKEAVQKSDIIIDFSRPNITLQALTYAVQYNKPIVIGTTGFTKEEFKIVEDLSQQIKILYSSNMSIGVNAMLLLASLGASILSENNFDVSLIDIHHKHKIDSPSGTAISIQNALSSYYENIPTASLRTGEIVGDHKLTFAGFGERLEINHVAENRRIFADGALKAAKWLYSNPSQSGLFSIKDMFIKK